VFPPETRAVIDQLQRKYGAGTIVSGDSIKKSLTFCPTGALSLDLALGGGWVQNKWVEIVGWESAAKSALALKTVAYNQQQDPDFTTVWIAAEPYVEEYATMLGVDNSRVIVVEENQMERAFEIALRFLQAAGSTRCLVIDSLAALEPAREEEKTIADFQPGLGAYLTGKFFRMAQPSLNHLKRLSAGEKVHPVLLLVINQWREKIGGYGDPKTTPGGKAKNYYYFQRIDVSRAGWLESRGKPPHGQIVRVRVLKNKAGAPGGEATLDYYFAGHGPKEAGTYDTVKDLINTGRAYDVITGGSGGFRFAGRHFKSAERLYEEIDKDEALQRYLYLCVFEIAQGNDLPSWEEAMENPPAEVLVPSPPPPAAKPVRRVRRG